MNSLHQEKVAHPEELNLVVKGHDFRANNGSTAVEGHHISDGGMILSLHSHHARNLDDRVFFCLWEVALQKRYQRFKSGSFEILCSKRAIKSSVKRKENLCFVLLSRKLALHNSRLKCLAGM